MTFSRPTLTVLSLRVIVGASGEEPEKQNRISDSFPRLSHTLTVSLSHSSVWHIALWSLEQHFLVTVAVRFFRRLLLSCLAILATAAATAVTEKHMPVVAAGAKKRREKSSPRNTEAGGKRAHHEQEAGIAECEAEPDTHSHTLPFTETPSLRRIRARKRLQKSVVCRKSRESTFRSPDSQVVSQTHDSEQERKRQQKIRSPLVLDQRTLSSSRLRGVGERKRNVIRSIRSAAPESCCRREVDVRRKEAKTRLRNRLSLTTGATSDAHAPDTQSG